MTRVRVLQRAIAILKQGWIPYGPHSQSMDKQGKPVAYTHPDACKFDVTGAVARAIYETTGDNATERNDLWDAALQPFKTKYGGWTQMHHAFEQMDKETAIATLRQQLDEWNNL